ncbi:anti-sigma factor antagonist [Shewanella livingstonensis]|uniref:Anti-sigma factor antagonist n=1 Tax=Shewanella livingstonensis TaxID=150120 RepID=A0A3G8M1S1_9GAMM|nr:STAS domain-containing protein [Shewanella livingstonensis]AZG74940.1 anti-sigma factor antagonist [Shewanella livingstonensis]
MNIEIEQHNNYQVVKLYGEVDLNNSRSIKIDIIKLIKSKNNIIVDFTHLQYIDSSGMASLVEAFNEAKENNTEFHIAAANGSPLQVLQLTRLNTVFNLVDSVGAVTNNG